MNNRPSLSHSFLLRCWQERNPQTGRPNVWRFSLEDVRTRRRVGFATLEAMLAYVNDRLEPVDRCHSEREVSEEIL